MHRCLEIPEILFLICEHIYYDVPPAFNWDTESIIAAAGCLLPLSLTSKYISAVASDILWRRLPSFQPLLGCMPDDLWREDGTLVLARPIIPSDWDKALVHADSVQYICDQIRHPSSRIDSAIFSRFTPDHAAILWAVLPRTPLLPNLQSVLAGRSGCPSIPHIRYIIPKQLRTVEVDFYSFSCQRSRSNLQAIAVMCPTIRRLDIAGTTDIDVTNSVSAISNIICSLNHLEWLSSQSLNAAAFAHVAQLPMLQTLKLISPYDDHQPLLESETSAFLRSLPGGVFPALQDLTFHGRQLDVLNDLLDTITFPSLHSLRILVPKLRSVDAWRAFFIRLTRACSVETLQQIIVMGGPILARPSQTHTALLEPLLSFPNISLLCILTPSHSYLDESMLEKMAKAWPHLERLEISCFADSKTSIVPMQCLIPFARHCPRVSRISLGLDANSINESNYVKESSAPLHDAPFSLRPNTTNVKHPLAVSRFLKSYFRNIHLEAFGSGWDGVRAAMQRQSTHLAA